MGIELVKAGIERDWLEFVAGIVFDPAKEGRDLGEIAGVGPLGAPCTTDVEAALGRDDVDLVFYTGIGNSAEIAGYCKQALLAGRDCVTLSGLIHVPTAIGAAAAADLDAAAVSTGARFVGTGIAPGFVNDVLPVVLLSAAVRYDRVVARLGGSMNSWGPGVLRAYGIGLTPEQITPPASRVSMKESVAVIGEAIGLTFDEITERNEPLISRTRREGYGLVVEPGTVTGFQRRFSGWVDGREKVVLEWNGAFLLDPEQDGFADECTVEVEGGDLDWMKVRLDGGLWADPYPATAARGLAVVPGLRSLPPGVYDGAQIPFGVRADRST
jgi:4-hydroxy-tetrahydrodipicolinate reductase